MSPSIQPTLPADIVCKGFDVGHFQPRVKTQSSISIPNSPIPFYRPVHNNPEPMRTKPQHSTTSSPPTTHSRMDEEYVTINPTNRILSLPFLSIPFLSLTPERSRPTRARNTIPQRTFPPAHHVKNGSLLFSTPLQSAPEIVLCSDRSSDVAEVRHVLALGCIRTKGFSPGSWWLHTVRLRRIRSLFVW